MSEVVTFNEGSAQFATANGAFTTQIYVRNVSLNPQRESYRYRAVGSPTHTHVDLQMSNATFGVTIPEGPDAIMLKRMLALAAPGTFHMNVQNFIGPAGSLGSAGFYCYSGTIDAASFAGQVGGDEQPLVFNGWLESWSAY